MKTKICTFTFLNSFFPPLNIAFVVEINSKPSCFKEISNVIVDRNINIIRYSPTNLPSSQLFAIKNLDEISKLCLLHDHRQHFFNNINIKDNVKLQPSKGNSQYWMSIEPKLQTDGIGRPNICKSGNTIWESGEDDIKFSIVIPNKDISFITYQITPILALIISDILQNLNIPNYIKWPNDIYIKKKCAGILVHNLQVEVNDTKNNFFIVGVGINLINDYNGKGDKLGSYVSVGDKLKNEIVINIINRLKALLLNPTIIKEVATRINKKLLYCNQPVTLYNVTYSNELGEIRDADVIKGILLGLDKKLNLKLKIDNNNFFDIINGTFNIDK